jgi:hypothetical protein
MTDGDWGFFPYGTRETVLLGRRVCDFFSAGVGFERWNCGRLGYFSYGPTSHANIIYCGQKFESSKCL